MESRRPAPRTRRARAGLVGGVRTLGASSRSREFWVGRISLKLRHGGSWEGGVPLRPNRSSTPWPHPFTLKFPLRVRKKIGGRWQELSRRGRRFASVWRANAATGTSHPVGLTGAGYVRADGTQSNSAFLLQDRCLLGVANRYPGSISMGNAVWTAPLSAPGTTCRMGLFDAEHTHGGFLHGKMQREKVDRALLGAQSGRIRQQDARGAHVPSSETVRAKKPPCRSPRASCASISPPPRHRSPPGVSKCGASTARRAAPLGGASPDQSCAAGGVAVPMICRERKS